MNQHLPQAADSGLESFLNLARGQLNSPKSQALLEAAKGRHELLQSFKKASDIVVYIRSTEPTPEMRDSICYVLLEEFQRQKEAQWGFVLVELMAPMLRRLRGRILTWCVEPADLDQAIIEMFWLTLSNFDLVQRPNRVLLRLRQNVQKPIFRWVNQEQWTYTQQESLKSKAEILHFNPLDEIKEEDQSEVMADILIQSLEGVLPQEKLNLVVQTTVQKRKLRDYVRGFSDEYQAEAEQERRYQVLKHKRARILRRMQRLLIDFIDYDETFLARFPRIRAQTRSTPTDAPH